MFTHQQLAVTPTDNWDGKNNKSNKSVNDANAILFPSFHCNYKMTFQPNMQQHFSLPQQQAQLQMKKRFVTEPSEAIRGNCLNQINCNISNIWTQSEWERKKMQFCILQISLKVSFFFLRQSRNGKNFAEKKKKNNNNNENKKKKKRKKTTLMELILLDLSPLFLSSYTNLTTLTED